MKIGLVGTCAAGKSTLGELLTRDGYQVRQIAQEHSYVKEMWRLISNPDYLIYLDVSYENTLLRRKLTWKRKDYNQQLERLRHAREHADLTVDTNNKSIEEVHELIHQFLKEVSTTR